ncbi:hypothetical protein QFZ80_000908 [Paenibacillus sp. V4I7]|nr:MULTISPECIES: hypothetical protein [unclassified Paenibacillus]MDQ0897080.1 hypothetical protein [Paenibacillus sp. V4I7]MDQ0916770.1 hypothetical protein [Paenibacillus sp. V4I5]
MAGDRISSPDLAWCLFGAGEEYFFLMWTALIEDLMFGDSKISNCRLSFGCTVTDAVCSKQDIDPK